MECTPNVVQVLKAFPASALSVTDPKPQIQTKVLKVRPSLRSFVKQIFTSKHQSQDVGVIEDMHSWGSCTRASVYYMSCGCHQS